MRDHRPGELFGDPFHLWHKGIRGDGEQSPEEDDRYREGADHPGDEGTFDPGRAEAMLGHADVQCRVKSA
ncbi:hypothetical protein MAHJHV60_46650 [Mycobacterium avium subsp. hominissuis]